MSYLRSKSPDDHGDLELIHRPLPIDRVDGAPRLRDRDLGLVVVPDLLCHLGVALEGAVGSSPSPSSPVPATAETTPRGIDAIESVRVGRRLDLVLPDREVAEAVLPEGRLLHDLDDLDPYERLLHQIIRHISALVLIKGCLFSHYVLADSRE